MPTTITWKIVEMEGTKYFMEVKSSWGKVYKSFDGGDTWFTTRAKAFAHAKSENKLKRA